MIEVDVTTHQDPVRKTIPGLTLPDHPIRWPQVQEDIERKTRELLADGGAGSVTVQFDYNRGRCVCYRVVVGYSRSDLNLLTKA